MSIHPRTEPWLRASRDIREILGKLQGDYGLTDVEMLRVLFAHQQDMTVRMLRAERHPGHPGRRADTEYPSCPPAQIDAQPRTGRPSTYARPKRSETI
ncbi:hypothetical protein ACFUYE_15015 [Micromonospora humida]|uniref:hypothetical protein n=1 Tax=Micromonospora humida TaxID=2809018 RepID=UPI00366CE449